MTKADRRRFLLDRAFELSRAQGTAALTLVTLAEAAQVSRPVVYEHFGTREGASRARGRPRDGGCLQWTRGVFDRHRDRLAAFGQAVYLGGDPGAAARYDLALLNLAWATLAGFVQTAALLGTAGIRAGEVAPLLTGWLAGTVSEVITDYAGQLDRGSYPGDGEWLELDAPLMDHLVETTGNSASTTRSPPPCAP
ncbi:hypothetical protein A4R43_04115 [Amycolatopsis albispora]|uniref:Uncharacterized protein n=1 Tax=Amycolatopsis albispora TaxID=1804986 RepID=A0A344L187_9PSEU|nr:hypothetical protein A4R43_04115 [Amycolatopsis albispora]